MQVGAAEKEGAVQKALAQGWQREVAMLQPQLHRLQTQLDAIDKQVYSHSLLACNMRPAQGLMHPSITVSCLHRHISCHCFQCALNASIHH